jgi:hypothetical protein
MFAGYMALRMGSDLVPTLSLRAKTPMAIAFVATLGAAHYLIVLAWVVLAWKGVPPSHRGTMTPWRAALTFLLPLYNLYWAFAMNAALCDTLDGILVSAGSDRRAPRTLGIVASATWVSLMVIGALFSSAHRGLGISDRLNDTVGMALSALMGSLWLAYMILCDRAREEVARVGADPRALGAPRLSRVQRVKGAHPVAAIAVSIIAIVGFLGCWQILQPSERTPEPSTHP